MVVTHQLPAKATSDNLFELLWQKEKFTNAIFDRPMSKVRKYHLEAFFIHLVAVEFIGLEKRGDELFWNVVMRGEAVFDENANFEFDDNWDDVHLFADDHEY